MSISKQNQRHCCGKTDQFSYGLATMGCQQLRPSEQ